MDVSLVYSPAPRVVRELALVLDAEATVEQALKASGWLAELTPKAVHSLEVGVWGSTVPLSHVLRQDDRVELYRPLKVDPKVARRERFVKQGAKSAGLFAKKRPGAKAGY